MDIVIASVCPSVCRSIHYAFSSLTMGQNSTKYGVWVTHMNGARNDIFSPPTGALDRDQKVKISFNFHYKVNFKDFLTKLCVCSHKWKIQNISDRVFILSPRSCPRGGTWGVLRGQNQILFCCLSLCYLLLSHWTKFNQIWCVSYSHEWGVQLQKCLAPPPGEGSKGHYNLISITKSISKIFIPNVVFFSQM